MIYGTLQSAMEYANRGCIEEWLQLFLRGDGHNEALADGLLLKPREYWGPAEIELKSLDKIQPGAPEYLTKDEEIAYFFDVVNRMKNAYGEWNPPPLILEYSKDSVRVNDGRHRLEMYRQLKIEKAWAVCWKTREKASVSNGIKEKNAGTQK